jgi:arginyl-tRNA synthetase
MKDKVRSAVQESLSRLFGDMSADPGLLPPVIIETPPEEKFGDFSSNAAMVSAKPLKSPPRKIAERLKVELEKIPLFSSVEIAGPGFINIFIKPSAWVEEFAKIPDDSSEYGSSNQSRDGKYLIEFVSANPTGPLHIGHGRGAAVGDCLARLLRKGGYDVTTEYYINDTGLQMENLGRSTYARYREHFGEKIEFPENGYKGEYIKDIAKEVADKEGKVWLGKPEEEAVPFFSGYTADTILEEIKTDLEKFRVSFDEWTSEKGFHEGGKVEKVIKKLQDSGEIYEKESALWLKTEKAGDEKDRVVKRGNGITTYLAADIAYHEEKYERGFTDIVDIWGADHHGYVARMKASVAALGHDPESLKPLLIQLVNLKKGGAVVAMSTRGGTFTTLAEVLSEVGVDAARFFFLMRSYDSHLDFDLDLAKEESSENPVYYVQYAHARISNIFVTAGVKGFSENPPENPDLSLLKLDEELRIMKKCLAFPGLVSDCSASLAPHHITHYLGDLAGLFHRYYNANRVVSEEKGLTNARLAMISRVRTVIKNGLDILGVTAPKRMDRATDLPVEKK